MLFKRRDKLKKRQKLANFFAPTKGLKRSFVYIWRRIWRINATPYAIAFGVAAGGFASCTPFLGLHFVIAAVIAYIFSANLLASALGTAIGNPLTFPFIWFAIKKIGDFILGNERIPNEQIHITKHMFHNGWDGMWLTLKPMIIGAIPLGLLVGAVMYFIVYRAVVLYQKARSHRFKS
ncbi:MAG: hypothetical protein COB24_12535 [Hyphomicrobiales bacterium]|nr:MAG: hypothetical protein COB24_12535 [Hyphomicrobiales bacterium]